MCSPCPCNQHATCDQTTGVCGACSGNTAGSNCQNCVAGVCLPLWLCNSHNHYLFAQVTSATHSMADLVLLANAICTVPHVTLSRACVRDAQQTQQDNTASSALVVSLATQQTEAIVCLVHAMVTQQLATIAVCVSAVLHTQLEATVSRALLVIAFVICFECVFCLICFVFVVVVRLFRKPHKRRFMFPLLPTLQSTHEHMRCRHWPLLELCGNNNRRTVRTMRSWILWQCDGGRRVHS